MLREIVQRNRARVGASEGVEQVGHADAVCYRRGLPAGHVRQFDRFELRIVPQRAEEHLIGDERVHPVDGDELLGQRVRRRMVLGGGPDDAAEDFVVIEKFEDLLQLGAGKPVPYAVHRIFDGRVRHDRRRPLRGVNLGHQGGVDELRRSVQPGIVPVRMIPGQQVADVVVLLGEDRVEHRQPDPPVVGETAQVHAGLGVHRQQLCRFEPELAALACSQRRRHHRIRAVNLRSIPPVAVRVRVCRGPGRSGGRRFRHRARYLHAAVCPVVAGRKRYLEPSSMGERLCTNQSCTMN